MLCDILKPFPYSLTGTDRHLAVRGGQVDIPGALVPGLAAEGFVRPVSGPEAKALSGAPENKAIFAAPENKADDDPRPALREEYKRVLGKKPFAGWNADKLREKIAEAGG